MDGKENKNKKENEHKKQEGDEHKYQGNDEKNDEEDSRGKLKNLHRQEILIRSAHFQIRHSQREKLIFQ